jgi:hypothetical protein
VASRKDRSNGKASNCMMLNALWVEHLLALSIPRTRDASHRNARTVSTRIDESTLKRGVAKLRDYLDEQKTRPSKVAALGGRQ